MMKIILFVMLGAWSYGEAYSNGGGVFTYVDSTGNRYGGTYGLKDGKVVSTSGDPFNYNYNPGPVPFADNAFPAFDGEDFGAAYFANLQNILQEAFKSNVENQKLAFDAAKKAYDLTSNHDAGYIPHLTTRFPGFNNFPPYGFPTGFNMPNYVPNFPNRAFAGAAAGPGFHRQVASIFPSNPANPNVNVNQISHFADTPSRGGFYSVSSNSYASSANVNGKETAHRGAETTVNDNGKITHYKVHN